MRDTTYMTGLPVKGIRRYTPSDYELVASWYEKRGLEMPKESKFPDTTYICDNRCLGFLLCTNGSVAMIEGIISDPDTVPSLRRESLKKLIGFLADFALALGYEDIIGITQAPTLVDTVQSLGFQEIDFRVVLLSDQFNEE